MQMQCKSEVYIYTHTIYTHFPQKHEALVIQDIPTEVKELIFLMNLKLHKQQLEFN